MKYKISTFHWRIGPSYVIETFQEWIEHEKEPIGSIHVVASDNRDMKVVITNDLKTDLKKAEKIYEKHIDGKIGPVGEL